MRIATLVSLALIAPAQAAVPGPICARPEVLRLVAETMAQRGLYAQLDPREVGEVTAADGASAQCAVWLHTVAYDTNVRAYVPEQRWEVHSFAVRRLHNGLVVDAIR